MELNSFHSDVSCIKDVDLAKVELIDLRTETWYTRSWRLTQKALENPGVPWESPTLAL
jgi:hypothetical protein